MKNAYTLWHYLLETTLPAIVGAGALLPSAEVAWEDIVLPPLLWLSRNPVLEFASRAAAVLDLSDTEDLECAAWREPGHRLARIAVPSTLGVPWLYHPAVAAMADHHVWRLAYLGVEAGGNPDDWYVSGTPIPHEQWLGVQLWTPDGWRRAGADEWVPRSSA